MTPRSKQVIVEDYSLRSEWKRTKLFTTDSDMIAGPEWPPEAIYPVRPSKSTQPDLVNSFIDRKRSINKWHVVNTNRSVVNGTDGGGGGGVGSRTAMCKVVYEGIRTGVCAKRNRVDTEKSPG